MNWRRIEDRLLILLGLVRKKDSDEVIRALRGAVDRDSTLAAKLADECRRLEQDNDQLSDENAKLIEENERVTTQFASYQGELEYVHRLDREKTDLICRVYELLSEDPRQPGSGAAKALNEILEYWREDDEEEDG